MLNPPLFSTPLRFHYPLDLREETSGRCLDYVANYVKLRFINGDRPFCFVKADPSLRRLHVAAEPVIALAAPGASPEKRSPDVREMGDVASEVSLRCGGIDMPRVPDSMRPAP